MKKVLFFVAFATVLFASCKKEQKIERISAATQTGTDAQKVFEKIQFSSNLGYMAPVKGVEKKFEKGCTPLPQVVGQAIAVTGFVNDYVTIDGYWFYQYFDGGLLSNHDMTLKVSWNGGAQKYTFFVTATSVVNDLGLAITSGVSVPKDRPITFLITAYGKGGCKTSYEGTFAYTSAPRPAAEVGETKRLLEKTQKVFTSNPIAEQN